MEVTGQLMPTVAFESEAGGPPQLVWTFRRRWFVCVCVCVCV